MAVLNRWSDADAQAAVAHYGAGGVSEALALRTYSARLLGADPGTGAARRRQHLAENQRH